MQINYNLSGHDLTAAFESLISQIEEMLAFGKRKFKEETSGGRGRCSIPSNKVAILLKTILFL